MVHWLPPSCGICLLSPWQAETFHEDLNGSLEDSANIYLCKCCYSNVCLCIICHSLQVSPKQQQSFWWWIHLHISAFQVISLHENCHEKVFPCSGMRQVKHMGNTSADVVEKLLFPYSLTFYTPTEGERFCISVLKWGFFEFNRAKKLPLLLIAN